MESRMKKQEFLVHYDEIGRLVRLMNQDDPYEMNWVEGSQLWGSVVAPTGIEVTRSHYINQEQRLVESFQFTNTSDFPIYMKSMDLGIYATFNDNYQEASECMKRRCHAHIWCGEQVSYIMALRMGGEGSNLGLILRKGSMSGYSIERDESKISNDRGDFILHPVIHCLNPNETAEIEWELFWFNDKADFYKQLGEYHDIPLIRSKQFTYFIGETIEFTVTGKTNKAPNFILIELDNRPLSYEIRYEDSKYFITAHIPVQEWREYHVGITINGVSTKACFYGIDSLEEVMKKRCLFIVEKQQENRGALEGAYIIYDKEAQNRYYSHRDDHNGGRERLGMGALVALYLQSNTDEELAESLERYISYVYRELYDEELGNVYNDINRNNDWDRLYNYPWMSIFQLEVYKWKGEIKFLSDACSSMKMYYQKGGTKFYGIGIPIIELVTELERVGLIDEANGLRESFVENANQILRNSLNYPPSEVNYEQSIVASAVSILLQVYELTGEYIFFKEAEKQMKVLDLFNGEQPDYHLYENAIRHWDGYWFGKKRNYGDTFPHYWSMLSGLEYERMFRIGNKKSYALKASASLRGCLNLFEKDGWASCAMVYPESVNGKATHYYDPWANDQDWALYYAWKLKGVVEKVR